MNNEKGKNGQPTGTETMKGTLICPSCHAIACGSDTYCAWCGGGLVRLCPDCHAWVFQPVAYYCTQCGSAL